MFNPFRDLINALTGRTDQPTIRTATEPARVRNTGHTTATGPGSRANTGLRIDPSGMAQAAAAMQRAAADMQRHGMEMRRQGSRMRTGGRGVAITNDGKGSHIIVNGRTIDITPDGHITVDGEPFISGERILAQWADTVGPDYRDSLTAPTQPAVTIGREAANQIENLLIDVEGTNHKTGTRINALRRILSDAISESDRRRRG